MKWVGDRFEPEWHDKLLHRIGIGIKTVSMLVVLVLFACSVGYGCYSAIMFCGFWLLILPVVLGAMWAIGHWMIKKGHWKEVEL